MKYIGYILLFTSKLSFCQSIPQTITTDHVQASIGDANGLDIKMPPIVLCNYFFLEGLNRNSFKYTTCDNLQDIEEYTIVNTDNAQGTIESWSKHYLGYLKSHPLYYSDGRQFYNINITLIFRNNKYSVLIESASIDKAGMKTSIANMYFNL